MLYVNKQAGDSYIYVVPKVIPTREPGYVGGKIDENEQIPEYERGERTKQSLPVFNFKTILIFNALYHLVATSIPE